MNVFQYAKNFFNDAYVPQQLTWAFGLFLLSLVAVMAGLVLIRRAFGRPGRSSAGAPPPPGPTAFERYEIGARLWHVGLVGILLALWLSGAAFYAPGIVPWPGARHSDAMALVHLAFGVMFMPGLAVHVIKAPMAGGRSMWFDRHDRHQLASTARYYFGLSQELPKLGKYTVSSRVFHVLLIALTLIMIVSGICLSLDTLGWAELDQNWQRRQRLLHDLGSYGFLAIVAGHVFWQLLKSRSQSIAMVTGKIDVDTFSAHHDWDRWKPDVVSPTADKAKVDHGQ